MLDFNLLLMAIMMVESGGCADPNSAIGDQGRSVGCMQIQVCVIEDINRVYGLNYTPADRYSREKSLEMAEWYLAYWGKVYTQRTGKKPTYEIYAKIWNGGALAYEKTNPKVVKRLDNYWNKVKAHL